jgi:hypothetical protein
MADLSKLPQLPESFPKLGRMEALQGGEKFHSPFLLKLRINPLTKSFPPQNKEKALA